MAPPLHHRNHRHYLFESTSTPVLERELTWFFTESETAASLPSNFAALRDTALSGRAPGTAVADHAADDRMDAAYAAGTIERRLRAMPDRDAGILLAAFEPRAWPEQLEAELGPLTGIAVRLAAAQRYGGAAPPSRQRQDETAISLGHAITRDGSYCICLLRAEAQGLLTRALRAYAKVRGLGPSVLPARCTDAS